jgi:hypothetical protein
MVKKTLLVLVLAALAAGMAFAQPEFKLSAGGGGFFDASFSAGKIGDADCKDGKIGGGIYAFFDATYAEIDLDLLFSSLDSDTSEKGPTTGFTYFGFSVLGKYPFAVGPGTLFPLVGIDYQIFLAGQLYDEDGKKVDDGDFVRSDIEDPLDPADYDAFSIVVGAGYDFPITDALYIRGEFLWNFKLDSKNEADRRKDAKDADIDYTRFTSGPRLKVGVGFKF